MTIRTKLSNGTDFDDLRCFRHNKPAIFELSEGGSVPVTVLSDEHIDSSRWTEIRRIVWREDGQLFACEYEVPLTEDGDADWYFDQYEVYPVEAVERTVTEYVKVVTA